MTGAKRREVRTARRAGAKDPQGFVPCSPDLRYCSDCGENRRSGSCPRLGRKGSERHAPTLVQRRLDAKTHQR
jgi:hypothetical protein